MAQRVLDEPVSLDFANGQVITTSNSSQQSSAFTGVSAVRIATGAHPVWFRTGSNPTAVSNGASALLSAESAIIVKISPGDKVAVIQASGSTDVSLVPVN